MNKSRLLKMARLLEADAKNNKGIKFDLNIWGNIGNESKPASCGTTACAMGLAVVSGAFHNAGLLPPHFNLLEPCLETAPGRISMGFRAAEKLFDITKAQALNLFSASRYDDFPTKGADGELAVAKRIRELVRTAR